MGLILICIIVGAIIGAVVAFGLFFVTNLGAEVCSGFNCLFGCGFNCHGIEGGSSFSNLLRFCVIGGAIIGLVFGICLKKADREAEVAEVNRKIAHRQGIARVSEIKEKATNVNIACNENKLLNKPLVSITYIADSQMNDIMNELVNMAELQGKVDALAEELSEGGVAK